MKSAGFERFMVSADINYERWHDGIGYDLEAFASLDGRERAEAEQWLLAHAGNDWRDIEGLLTLGSVAARAAVIEQLRHGKLEQRLWAAKFLAGDPTLAADREAAVVAGLESAVFYGGLSVALDLATEERTPAMVDALFRACFREQGEGAVHAAARLAFIHGAAKEAFDWDLRPLLLRFNTPDPAERATAFRDLCALCKVNPAPYLRT